MHVAPIICILLPFVTTFWHRSYNGQCLLPPTLQSSRSSVIVFLYHVFLWWLLLFRVVPTNSTKHFITCDFEQNYHFNTDGLGLYAISFISSQFQNFFGQLAVSLSPWMGPWGQYWSLSFFQNVFLENMSNIHSVWGNGSRIKMQFPYSSAALLLSGTQCWVISTWAVEVSFAIRQAGVFSPPT